MQTTNQSKLHYCNVLPNQVSAGKDNPTREPSGPTQRAPCAPAAGDARLRRQHPHSPDCEEVARNSREVRRTTKQHEGLVCFIFLRWTVTPFNSHVRWRNPPSAVGGRKRKKMERLVSESVEDFFGGLTGDFCK